MAGEGVPSFEIGAGAVPAPVGRAADRPCGASSPPNRETSGRDAEAPVWTYAGARLALARRGGANADDRFGATGTLSALIEGGAIVVGGVIVGSVRRNSGGALLLTFAGAEASEDNVDAVLRQITYANAAHRHDEPVEIHWVFTDGGALIAEGHTLITVDDAPIWRCVHRAA